MLKIMEKSINHDNNSMKYLMQAYAEFYNLMFQRMTLILSTSTAP